MRRGGRGKLETHAAFFSESLGLRRLACSAPGLALWLVEGADRAAVGAEVCSAEEKARADRFLRAEDRNRFLRTRAALRHLLAEAMAAPAKDIRFETGPNGKPFLASALAPHFNASHSGGLGLIGISAHDPIGVDVELIRGDINELELARGFFCPREHHFLAGLQGESRLRAFYRIWTCKEAVLKAFGVGIAINLKDFSVELTSGGVKIHPEPRCFTPALGQILVEPITVPAGYAAVFALAQNEGSEKELDEGGEKGLGRPPHP